MQPLRLCLVGAGNHIQANLLPAVLRLNKKAVITGLCRKDVSKGDLGLNVPLYAQVSDIKDVDVMVASGPPDLHLEVLRFSKLSGIPCFVEKPHLIDPTDIPEKTMIGYNFNFLPFPFENIGTMICGTQGLYKSWGNIFVGKNEDYLYALHSVVIHPISIMVRKYGLPISLKTDCSNNKYISMKIIFDYPDQIRVIEYNSNTDRFMLHVASGDDLYDARPDKTQTYHTMLEYYFDCLLSNVPIKINSKTDGDNVLSVIQAIVKQLP